MAQHYVSEASDGTMKIMEQADTVNNDRELSAADLAKLPAEELKALASAYWSQRLGGMTKRGAGSPFFRRA